MCGWAVALVSVPLAAKKHQLYPASRLYQKKHLPH